jgi:hypothetical protein
MGVMTPAANRAARRRSSGTHLPRRRLRHLMITWSEIRPATAAPTKTASVKTGGVGMGMGGAYGYFLCLPLRRIWLGRLRF